MPDPSLSVLRKPPGFFDSNHGSRARPAAAGLLLWMVSAPILAAQNLSAWQAGSGAWLDAAKWTPNGVPNAAAADVVIDGAPGTSSTVTYGYDPGLSAGVEMQVGRLRIEAGDQLLFTNRPNVLSIVDSGFAGAGVIQLNGTLAMPFTNNSLYGSKTISGTGTLTLGGAGHRAFVRDNTATGVLIQGSAAFGVANSSNPRIVNSGTINANIQGQDMDFHGQGGANRSVNTGMMKATNGGILSFGQGEWLNTGATMTADGAGSRVGFYRGGLIEGGTISAKNGGVVQVGGNFAGGNGGSTFRNVTLDGPSQLVQELQVGGTLTNNGVMTIPGGAQVVNATDSVTINGTGEIKLDADEDNAPELINQGNSSLPSVPWLFSGVKIHGRGNVGYRQSGGAINNVVVTNQGTFEADVDGQTLLIAVAGFDNRSGGVLRATGTGNNTPGGILRLAIGGALRNTGGTIEALNRGRVEAAFARIEGGLIRNNGGVIGLGGTTLVNPGTGMRLEGDLKLGVDGANQEAFIEGDIGNTGILRVAASSHYARLRVGASATRSASLSGGGQLILGDPAGTSMESGLMESFTNSETFTLTNVDNTIRGFGRIGDPTYDRWLVFNNSGTVNADVPGKTLQAEMRLADNTGGTFRASGGGRLVIYARNGFDNSGGHVEALSGSTVQFSSTSIMGGNIDSAAAGKLEFPNSGAARDGVTIHNAGTAEFGSSGGTVTFEGLDNGGSTFNNAGTIRKTGSGDYTLRTVLNSSGAISVENGVFRNMGGGTLTGGTFNVAGGAHQTFQYAPGYVMSGENVFTGAGTHWFGEGVPITLADAASRLLVENLNFNTATLTGPGQLSHVGNLVFSDNSTNTISGPRIHTAFGAAASIEVGDRAVTLSNSATWENEGRVTFKRFGNPRISGDGGTFFDNTSSGILSVDKLNVGFGIMDIPSANKGRIDVVAGNLSFEKPSAWTGGAANINEGLELRVTNTALTFAGTGNTTNGAGFLNLIGSGSLALPAGAKLTAERVQFNDASRPSGPGELNVTGEARFLPNSISAPLDATQVKLLPGSTSLIQYFGGVWGVQNNAKLRNEGTLDFRGGFHMELKTGGVLENAGTMTFTSQGNNPSFNGDDLGMFRTLSGSTARFFPSNGNSWTIGWPFDFAGLIAAESGMNLTFDRGGFFNESAKLLLPHGGSAISFTGAGKTYRARGRAVEFSGVGYVNFMGTTLQFEPSTLSTSGNGQLDETRINAGARVAFHGNNLVKSVGTHGTLSSTGLVFQSGDQTVENATLETTGGDTSVWNATGKKITFTSGAKFLNTGRFVIQTTAGGPGNPAFNGDAGTLFHNTSTGRLVHDAGSTTEFAMPFQNDGVLEFRAGIINFTGSFAGNGGISASGGAKVTLPLGAGALDKLPSLLQTSGLGTEINIALPAGDKLIRVDVNGGKLVAAGGGNMVAAGGLNMVAAGGGNIVAAGGLNLVAAGGGNITARDLNTLLVTNNLIGLDGSTLVGMNGSAMQVGGNLGLSSGAAMALTAAKVDVTNLVRLDDAGLVGNDGASLTNGGAMELVNHANASFAGPLTNADVNGLIGLDGSTLIGNDGSTIESHVGLIGNDGSTLIGNDGSTLIGNDGSTFQGAANLKVGSRAKGRAALAPGDATIIANTGTTIGGNGIFKGIGSIRSGSFLRPGKPVAQGGNQLGAMTWTGSLEVKNTATLEVQIGGPAAGTQHDRINVSGAFALDGILAVSFINGFGPGLSPASTFDIVVANGGATSALDGTRVPVANAYGSFLVSVVNAGTTMRLSDYQTTPATFNAWARRFGLTGSDALPGADPNQSGLTNLMKYALGLDSTASGTTGISHGIFEDGQGGRYLTLTYTRPTAGELPSDVTYEPQRAASAATGPWSGAAADVVSTGAAVPGPGNLESVTVRSTHPIGSGPAAEFLRLRVVLTPAL